MNILIDGQTLETEEINRGIGVYFKNVIANMIRYTTGNVWYITISNSESIKKIDRWTASRLNVIRDDIFAPSFEYDRQGLFTEKINDVIKDYNIDCFWIPNPLMVNVLFPTKSILCSCYATIYDLIPYLMPIKEWSDDIRTEYFRRLEYLKNTHMICISAATERDLKEKLGKDVSTSVTMLAANRNVFYKKREKNNISNNVNIVFTGGFDYRKNIDGAIEAFALAKRQIKDKTLKFYIVCKYNVDEKSIFDDKLKQLGVFNDVYLTGFITDDELAELYHIADVFFFPSFYEGFGLPLLEAMLGGAYILSADNSSLPEVCGKHALYCNANDINDMAEKLILAVLSSFEETVKEKQQRQEYALQFSWEKTAQKTYEILELTTAKICELRKKIAIVTPWLNQQTGIANYVYKLVPFLSQYFDIDIFVDNTLDRECQLLPNAYGGRYLIGDLETRYQDYDDIIYQLGNSTKYHSEIYRMFKKYNGTAEIHDFVLNPFFYHSYYMKGDKETYRQALIDGYGAEGEQHYNELEKGISESDAFTYPMSCSVSKKAKKTIVHNEWSYRQLIGSQQMYFIPLMAFERIVLSKNERRKAESNLYSKIRCRENDILIGCFGWVNANKRAETVLKGTLELRKIGYPVKLVFFGKSNYPILDDFLLEEEFKDFVRVTGFLEQEEYQIAMERCDIVVNLRHPSMGESSATLCETFKAGKPVIVTAINQYLEFPDEVCWKLPLGENEVPTLSEMLKYLIDYPEVRASLGRNAKVYADSVINGENIAKMYYRALT